MTRDVARELRRLRFAPGGAGVFVLFTPRAGIASPDACGAMMRAAGRLGFGRSWSGVARALSQWALGDVLSEAIEEQEALR